MWRSSWRLGSRRSPTPSRSSSPLRLLQPAKIVILKSTNGVRCFNSEDCAWELDALHAKMQKRPEGDRP
ncbi:hypothetical protein Taro_055724 [Colocasia esculenta]|uniref:Uncharacterized protein n=1 Tax=Colocasia esculenta TaxID=4460 RepID=A0A843XRP8_COLES|nr:hypothetical protein [Colocasia esculenta]